MQSIGTRTTERQCQGQTCGPSLCPVRWYISLDPSRLHWPLQCTSASGVPLHIREHSQPHAWTAYLCAYHSWCGRECEHCRNTAILHTDDLQLPAESKEKHAWASFQDSKMYKRDVQCTCII